MIVWDDLRILLALARNPSLRVAAETLNIDPTTVTRRLARLSETLDTTLFAGQERLYLITVPSDQTLRVRLQADNDTSANEIFIRHDAVPSASAFDATYSGPLAADIAAIVPSTEPGTYYVLVRGFGGPTTGTGIRLLTEKGPRAVTVNGFTTTAGPSA